VARYARVFGATGEESLGVRAEPGNPAARGADAAESVAHVGGQRPFRMLFVGDDPGDALRARALMNEAGLAAEWLEKGHLAVSDVEAVADWADCALVDMRPPEGLDVVRAILRRAPRLPVIVLAAAAGRERALAAVREGAQGYLKMERIDADQIARAVRQAIERKRLENELRRAEHLAGIGRLSGRMAQYLNNLLSIILNYAEFVAEALAGPLPHEMARRTQAMEDIGRIREAAQRAAGLARQLTILAEQDQLRPEVVGLNEVIEGARARFAARLGAGISLELALDPGTPPVQADRAHLEHLLSWLADNARDDLGGAGRVTISTALAGTALAGGGISGGGISGGGISGGGISGGGISGGGISGGGIDGEPADGSFAQLQVRDTGGGGGAGPDGIAGFGLAVVQAIVAGWGGRVDVRSQPGDGTTVTMLVPAVPPDSVARPAGQTPASHV
jgi:signal transduction histidine kinase